MQSSGFTCSRHRTAGTASSSSSPAGSPVLAKRPARRTAPVVAAIQTDATVRVKGNVRQVFNYCADFRNAPDWLPGIADVQVTRGDGKPISLRSQMMMQQTVASIKLASLYEVVDIVPDKKVTYSVASDLHQATESLVFMPDPNDPTFTMVRYMSHVELTEWRKALEPFVAGFIKKAPEQGLHALRALLNSSQSPLKHQDSHHSHGGSSAAGFNFSGLFNSLKKEVGADSANFASRAFSGFGTTGSSGGSATMKRRVAATEPQVDMFGYYAALGLDASRRRAVSADDIKSAFRKAAQTMHPDKFSLADEEDRLAAEENFKKVQKAYEVLRDPQQRRLYDEGKLSLEETSVM